MKKENTCDGCCYKKWHNGDTSKCNYLNKEKHCIINEKRGYKYEPTEPQTKRNPKRENIIPKHARQIRKHQ